MYSDLYIDQKPIWLGRICLGGVPQKQFSYLQFEGDLVWNVDPDYRKLGGEHFCAYISPEEWDVLF